MQQYNCRGVLGAGACVTTEMVLFEWLERKDSPAFAEILELVR